MRTELSLPNVEKTIGAVQGRRLKCLLHILVGFSSFLEGYDDIFLFTLFQIWRHSGNGYCDTFCGVC